MALTPPHFCACPKQGPVGSVNMRGNCSFPILFKLSFHNHSTIGSNLCKLN